MSRGLFLITILLIIFLAVFMINQEDSRVCFNDKCFEVEVASTSEEMKKGLMFRENLDSDKGMLFIYKDEDVRSFWMKNVKIPLDIIWIDRNKKVVFIEENASPCEEECISMKPDEKAMFVLELKGGMVEEIGLKVGDKLDIMCRYE